MCVYCANLRPTTSSILFIIYFFVMLYLLSIDMRLFIMSELMAIVMAVQK